MTHSPDGSVTMTPDEAAIVRRALRYYSAGLADVLASVRHMGIDDAAPLAAWRTADELRAKMEVTP